MLILADHVLGYVASTLDFALEYGPCPDYCDQYGRVHNLNRLEVLTDSSFAPTGGRGHQGIMAMWGGCLVAWESKAQAFATLSTTESELLGYIDGLTLGESVGAVANVLQENILDREGSYVLRGDNLSGLQLLQAPSGPWRTRHLRLRSHVLRERLKHHLWSVEHVPGTELCADLLTKSITQSLSWDAFRRSVGLRAAETSVSNEVGTSRAKKVACAAMASLGLLAAVPGLGGAVKLASLLGLAAAATVALNAFTTATGQSNKRSNASHVKKLSRWVREDEPTPSRTEKVKKDSRWLREDEPSPAHVGVDSRRPLPPWHPGRWIDLEAMEPSSAALRHEGANCTPRIGHRHAMGPREVRDTSYWSRPVGMPGIRRWCWRMVGPCSQEKQGEIIPPTTPWHPFSDFEDVTYQSDGCISSRLHSRSLAKASPDGRLDHIEEL